MKKMSFLFSILFFGTLFLTAQDMITMSGHVLNFEQSPIPNHLVEIQIMEDSAVAVTSVTSTGEMGGYEFHETLLPSYTLLVVSTLDCQGINHQESFTLNNGNNSFSNTFLICNESNEGCQANFDFEFLNSHYLHFHSLTVGEGLSYYWDFGDNATANTENPYHEFAENGTYTVCLTITNSDSTCSDTKCEDVYIGNDSTGCEASFVYEYVSNYKVHFISTSEGEGISYHWDFGDGHQGDGPNPYHEFVEYGTYNVCLSVSKPDSLCFDTFCQEILISGDSSVCQANFSYELYPNSYNMVQFVDLSLGSPDAWLWEFGDGTTSDEQQPVHQYPSPGYYNVCLHISGEGDCSDTFCETIAIQNDSVGCMASFTYYQSENQPKTIHFIDQSWGNPENYLWDFGDNQLSDNLNPVHEYAEFGTYEVCLTISGQDCESSWCAVITVSDEVDCYNYFTYIPDGYTIHFSGYSSNNQETSFLWEFGDGTSGTGQQISHTYSINGVYYVTLTTTIGNDCSAVSSQNVVVGDSIQFNQVYGQVFENNLPLSNGLALIFSQDLGNNYAPYLDFSLIDSSGVYEFPYVPNGDFYIYAIPLTNNGFLPTYYGDVLDWEDATLISLGQAENPYDINLISASSNPIQGNGSINGYITDASRTSYLDKVTVLLFNENVQPIAYANVNTEGHYSFNSLANGTYYIKPELSGVTSPMTEVILNSENQNAEIYMTLNGNQILDINEVKLNTLSAKIFPNPVIEKVFVEFNSQYSEELIVEVWSINGIKLSETNYHLPAGYFTTEINVGTLKSGMYFLKISSSNGIIITRKFIHQ